MATKQLSYNTNAIDDRLGKAHSHSNLENLNLLTDVDFENIKSIKDKLKIDMSNADLVALADAVKKSGVAFVDAKSNGCIFARKDGEWVDITSELKPVIGKGDTNVTVTNEVTDTNNVITVTLSSNVVKALNSIATKLDAIANPVLNDMVSVKADGTLQDSGIGKDDIILKSSLENSYLSQSKNTAPSSYALYQVYNMALGISGGVGQIRGTVYNAFTSSNCATIDMTRSISVVSPGENYAEGSLVYSSLGSIPAVFKIVEVESGSNGIKSLEVVNSGNFDINPSSDEISFSVYGNVGSGAQIKCYLDNSAVYSTLDNIENPTNSDLAIVLEDEYHNSSSSIYMYMNIEDSADSFNGWIWLASFSDANRNFTADPISTEEIQDNAITSDKLYKIPEKSLLANNSDSTASPTSMTFTELSYLLGVSGGVTGVKGSAESDYRQGNVEISLQDISGDNGLLTINNAGTSDYGDSIKYPRSVTPPLNSSDATIATTEFVRNKIMENNMSQTGTTSTYPYLGAGYYQILLSPGTYKLECWGAQGGCPDGTEYGGMGGYATVTVSVSNSPVTVYAAVGSHPTDSNGGFNGGGSGGFYYGKGGRCTGYGGGGATHIALIPGLLADLSNYNEWYEDRGVVISPKILLVAAGGGGAYGGTNTSGSSVIPDPSTEYTVWGSGGYGGSLVGGTGTGSSGAGGGGGGATGQGGATISESQMNNGQYNPTPGSFGKGGNGNSTTKSGYSANNGGAGGGGWFGGGGASPIYPSHNGYHTNTCYRGGGGGCGYTGTTYDNENISYVEGASLIAGNQTMPCSFDSTSVTVGNGGNGVIRITYYG